MADKLEDAEFWLPSEFLTDEDILMDNKENFSKFAITGSNSNSLGHRFPTEFPYDYSGSSVLSSPVDSSLGSPETESDEEDSLLTELTRQLTLGDTQKKGWLLSTSPQSTLTQVESWSGRSTVSSSGSPNGPSQVSSPPTTPLSSKNDAWDLIYQAAGQVARLKMNGGDGPVRNTGLPGPKKWVITPPPPKNPSGSVFQHNQWQQIREGEMLKQAGSGMWSGEVKSRWSYQQEVLQNRAGAGTWNINGRGFDQTSCAWPTPQVRQRPTRQGGDFSFRENGMCVGSGYGYGYGFGSAGGGAVGVGCGGGGLKKERTGTGVFLPRRYGNINNLSNTSDSRKKPGSSPANLHPARIMQDSTKMVTLAQPQPQARINVPSVTDYDMLIARRNALLAQHRRNFRPEGTMSHEICLPQEWTY